MQWCIHTVSIRQHFTSHLWWWMIEWLNDDKMTQHASNYATTSIPPYIHRVSKHILHFRLCPTKTSQFSICSLHSVVGVKIKHTPDSSHKCIWWALEQHGSLKSIDILIPEAVLVSKDVNLITIIRHSWVELQHSLCRDYCCYLKGDNYFRYIFGNLAFYRYLI